MKELMKGPNKRGREDFENAISDDLETQNFQNFPALCQPSGRASWEPGPLSLSSWLPRWPSCGIYINIPCKYFTEGSVYLQHNVIILYIQKSVSENAGIAVIGVEKYKIFLGVNTPRPPYYEMRYNIKIFVTNNHLLFLHNWYSMVPFCSWPPHWRILKKCPG